METMLGECDVPKTRPAALKVTGECQSLGQGQGQGQGHGQGQPSGKGRSTQNQQGLTAKGTGRDKSVNLC